MLRDWGLALLMAVACFVVADFVSGMRTGVGKQAPAFTLPDLAGGTSSLAEHRGKVVVLNFWATWCGPCKAEIPEFSAFAAQNPDVAVLGLVVPSSEGDQLATIVDQFPIRYRVLVADDAAVSDYGVSAFPTTVLVRPDGTIASVKQGAMDRVELAERVKVASGG